MSELEDFDKKLKAAQEKRDVSPENFKSEDSNTKQETSFGMRVAVEMFAAILVGVVIGFVLDKVFNSTPLCLIIFLIIGTAAGFWNVYKFSKNNS